MADQSDVEAALVAAVNTALYPAGTGQPSSIGAMCRTYRGWPTPAALDRDLKQGMVNVTVLPQAGGVRNKTRYQREWQIASRPAPTLGVFGPVVVNAAWQFTFYGTCTAGQLVGVMVTGQPYVYVSSASDTPTIVAAALAAAIPGASSSGAVLNLLSAAGNRPVGDASSDIEVDAGGLVATDSG